MTASFSVLRLLVLVALASGPAWSQDAGTLAVREAWSRATPGGAKVGAGYLVIENNGAVPQALVSMEADVAARAELHETVESAGVSRMVPIPRLEVAPGASVTFGPGGRHIMLVDLKRPLKQGERFGGVLVFEPAGRVEVQFEVRGIGAGGAHHAH